MAKKRSRSAEQAPPPKRGKKQQPQEQEQVQQQRQPKRRQEQVERQPKQEGRVGKAEHDAIVAALRRVDWASVVNTGRKNVIDPARAPHSARGKPFCQSFILGPNMKDPQRKPSYWTEQNPELHALLEALMRKHDPAHKFTNITVNRNFRCKPHRDRGNAGRSYIVGFGDYEGGELCVADRSRPKVVHELDLHRRFHAFYGGEQEHWTQEFSGERFTCVFYNFPELHDKAGAPKSPAEAAEPAPAPAMARKLEAFKARLKKNKAR